MFRSSVWLVLGLTAVLAGIPATLAGEEGHRCPEPTQNCLDSMVRHWQDRGWVGIEMDQDDETGTMTVTRVLPDSPASRAGMRAGDVLLALNGVTFCQSNRDKMYEIRNDWSPGKTVRYRIERQGDTREIELTLATIPRDVLALWVGRHMLDHAEVKPSGH